MTAIKSHQADNFAKSPPENFISCLIYGPDEGRVSENAANLARAWSAKHGEGGDIIRISERELTENPDLLAVELGSMAMFGGRSVIRVSACRHIKAPQIKELLALEPQNFLVIEAGDLKPSSPLRKLFEKGKNIAAIACYGDEERDLGRLVDDEMRRAGLHIDRQARALLIASLGADRGVSRQELAKLALYAHGQSSINSNDILAIVGDSSQMAWDNIINLTLAGKSAHALARLDHMLAAGQDGAALAIMFSRHLLRLYHVRIMADKGADMKKTMSRLRPPVHFRQQDAMMEQLRRFDAHALEKAMNIVQTAMWRIRSNPQLAVSQLERILLVMANLAAARRS
jgi:DNA polymerase-3 subunit delta